MPKVLYCSLLFVLLINNAAAQFHKRRYHLDSSVYRLLDYEPFRGFKGVIYTVSDAICLDSPFFSTKPGVYYFKAADTNSVKTVLRMDTTGYFLLLDLYIRKYKRDTVSLTIDLYETSCQGFNRKAAWWTYDNRTFKGTPIKGDDLTLSYSHTKKKWQCLDEKDAGYWKWFSSVKKSDPAIPLPAQKDTLGIRITLAEWNTLMAGFKEQVNLYKYETDTLYYIKVARISGTIYKNGWLDNYPGIEQDFIRAGMKAQFLCEAWAAKDDCNNDIRDLYGHRYPTNGKKYNDEPPSPNSYYYITDLPVIPKEK
jgi:hypothetical protein